MSEVFNSSVLDAINRATTYSSDYIDPSTLKVIVIDGETRHMTIPEGENLFGARGDKNVERKYFQCPKIVGDNVDLSQHLIYVSYVFTDIDSTTNLPETNIGMYHCEDVAVEGDNITFSWLLSGNVLHNPGFIAFKVCAKEKESDPTTVFNTTPAIGIVFYTIPDGSEIIPKEYPDIITQLLADMDATKEEVAAQIAEIDAIKDQIEDAVEGTLINDNTESNIFTYSSQKINAELRKKATYHDSVASMKADSSLKDGSIAVTLGYYSENDGGGATYLIRAKQSGDEDNGSTIHEINGGQLVAELIVETYITPEMFGTKGDGVSDDTEKLQAFLNSSYKNKVMNDRKYHITDSLIISGDGIFIYGYSAVIDYDGEGSAVVLTHLVNSHIEIGKIDASQGNAMEIRCLTNNDFLQYNDIYFKVFLSLDKEIFFNVTNGWATELRFFNGRLASGNYGFHIDNGGGTNKINNITIQNVGFEGIDIGMYIANNVYSVNVINARYHEGYEKIFVTEGRVDHVVFIGTGLFYYNKSCTFSENTGMLIIAPITYDSGAVFDRIAYVLNGHIVFNHFVDYYSLLGNNENEWTVANDRIFNYILCEGPKKITLNKSYGGTLGVHSFFVRNNGGSSDVSVYDSDGNKIVDPIDAYTTVRITWLTTGAWLVEDVNIYRSQGS